MNISFDALKYAKDLENAGFTRKQAEAMLAQNAAFQTELKKFDTDVKDSLAAKHYLTLAKSELQVEVEKNALLPA